MNTTELERRLGVVLQQHAEDAMKHTDTHAQLQTLQDDVEREAQRRRRLGWGAGALAAAAAVVAVVVVATSVGDDEPETAAEPPAPASTDVAAGFLAAYAAYDLDQAATYLADDATVLVWSSPQDIDGMRQEAEFSQAVGFRLLPGPCNPEEGSGATATVDCPFDFHALGSDELGRGPFSSNWFTFTIRDGEIVTAEVSLPYMTNGFSSQAWEPFAAWVTEKHPKDAAVMYADWPGRSMQSMTDRANELWQQNTRAYVDAVNEGTAE